MAKKQCAICNKELSFWDNKYDLLNKEKMCPACASKIGFTKYSMAELTATQHMTSDDVKKFISNKQIITAKGYAKRARESQKIAVEKTNHDNIYNEAMKILNDSSLEPQTEVSLSDIDLNSIKSTPSDVILKSNEFEYFRIDNANWLETRKKTDRVNYGGFTTSIKLTKNIRYRMGSIKPNFKSHDEWTQINSGKTILTNKRIIMLGKDTKQVTLSSIINIKPYSDGVELNRSSGKDVVLTGFDASNFYIILSRILNNDFESHSPNSSKYTPQELVKAMAGHGDFSYDSTKDTYTLITDDVVDVINDPKEKLDGFRDSLISASNELNERTDEPHPLSGIVNDPQGNQILIFTVNGDQTLYDVTQKQKTESNKLSENKISDTNIDDLRKLKELLDDGILTQEEFDAKKKQILGI
ncbi:SHOCT domain-containing protein [Companilactobacillus zhachilii]|uniref:SHOCT domain-containing protein n=1 Tax=Companilactobacillus zhachilii TaxID=2304606 RepID=UPI004034901B